MRISDWSSDVCSSDLFKLRTISPNVSPVFLRLTLGLDFSSVIFFRLTGAEGGGAGVGEGAGAEAGLGAGAGVGAGAGESATSPPKWAIRPARPPATPFAVVPQRPPVDRKSVV